MTDVIFVDTTLRDGQQSLWAYNMRTGMILPIVEEIDRAGFEAVEFGGPVELPKCIKELREDPCGRRKRSNRRRIRPTLHPQRVMGHVDLDLRG